MAFARSNALFRSSLPLVLVGLLLCSGELGAQVWEVDNVLLTLPATQNGAIFGTAMAVGDFDGDHFPDLAVAAPHWDSATASDVGRVRVYWGSADRGLALGGDLVEGGTDDLHAGEALAAGDFDHDGRDELAIGEPRADVSSHVDAGRVLVLRYQSGTWTNEVTLSRTDAPGGGPQDGDFFGYHLTVGDFDGNSIADLAVSGPYETVSSDADAGRVHVFYGSSGTGLSGSGATTIVSPNETAGEVFGTSSAAGDFDGDGYDDLAVGAPDRTVSGHDYAGAVEVYAGSSAGIATASPQLLTDAILGKKSEAGDAFGIWLAAGNFDQSPESCSAAPGACYADLAITVPSQTRDHHANAGKIVVAYGGPGGIATSSATHLGASDLGLTAADNDYLGYSITAGALDGGPSTPDDLAVAVPFRSYVAGRVSDGIAILIFGDPSGVNAGTPPQIVFQRPGYAIAPALDNDVFGVWLAIGDFDGDGWGDLAAAAPDKGTSDTGVVQVLFGALFADGFEGSSTGNWTSAAP